MVQKLISTAKELEAARRQVAETEAVRGQLAEVRAKVKALEAEVEAEALMRRKLHNQVQELKGNVRVYCRVRPMPARAEGGAAEASSYCMPDGTSVKLTDGAKDPTTFTYDKVFGPAATQENVFDEVSALVQSALDGYKVCLFSYGQTGAGKTHTMLGAGQGDQRGIVPRAVEAVLGQADKQREKGWEFAMEAAYVEIYNEQLRDLLSPGAAHSAAHTIQHFNGVTQVTLPHHCAPPYWADPGVAPSHTPTHH